MFAGSHREHLRFSRGVVPTGRGEAGQYWPSVAGNHREIVDPDTLQPVGADEAGLLLVRGPNIMRGYLNQPEKTAAVLRDGWYNTGDVARMDEDVFCASPTA